MWSKEHLYNLAPENSRVHVAYNFTLNVYHILKLEINFKKCKQVDIIQSMFSENNEIEPIFITKRYLGKFPNIWKIKRF